MSVAKRYAAWECNLTRRYKLDAKEVTGSKPESLATCRNRVHSSAETIDELGTVTNESCVKTGYVLFLSEARRGEQAREQHGKGLRMSWIIRQEKNPVRSI